MPSGINLKMSAAEIEYEGLMAQLLREFPDFRLVYKSSSTLMRGIDTFLRVITFGRMYRFMTDYVTTIGNTIYVTDKWSSLDGWSRSTTLRHERVHMRQRQRMGNLCYVFTYLFWPLPVVFAVGRRNLEREAYEETLRSYFEYFGSRVPYIDSVRDRIVGEFLGPDYFWMWPFRESVERWYDEVLSKLDTSSPEDQWQNVTVSTAGTSSAPTE